MLDRRLARFAGRVFTANIDVVIGHDWNPLLELDDNAQLPRKVAMPPISLSRPAGRFGSPAFEALLPQKG
jgi:hypothetical protein